MSEEIPYGFERVTKLDANGKQLYILPVADKEVLIDVQRTIKTTTATANKVMTSQRVPLLDESGQQRQYETTKPVVDENGVVTGQEGTGQFLKLWTTEEVQDKDDANKLLYWDTVIDQVSHFEKQPDKLINSDDTLFVEGLEEAYDLVEVPIPPQLPAPKSTDQIVREQGVEIKVLSEKVDPKNADEIYKELDTAKVALDELKTKKINQLNYLCNQDILNGFTSNAVGVDHTYGFSYEDQQNLASMLTLMNADSTITSADWKTYDSGIVNHTKAEFLTMCKDAQHHKQNKIVKYWTLKAQVKAATTNDAVSVIVW